MKMHASVYWKRTISLATAVVSVGIPWNLAKADGTLPNAAPATASAAQAAPGATSDTQAPVLPFGVSEVVRMYQGGIGKDVIEGYIENNVLPFHLTADGQNYLQHLGVPQEVISALIRRDGQLQRQTAAADQQQQQQQAAANNQVLAGNPTPTVVMPIAPPPFVPYAYPDGSAPVVYPDYAAYPFYGYPYFYGPDFIIDGGFGFDRGFGRGGGFGGRGRGGFGGGARGGTGGSGRGGFGRGHR